MSNLSRIIYDEAKLLAREKYHDRIPFALSILYSKLRSAGDTTSASVAYRLMEEMMENHEDKS